MAENRVVIKINYDKDKHRKALIDPKMVTVWHTRRILAAIAILVLMLMLMVLWFSAEDTANNIQQAGEQGRAESSAPIQTSGVIKPDVNDSPVNSEDLTRQSGIVKRPAAIIFDKRVIRAALTTVPKSGEPGDSIKVPVVMQPNETLELFYFSEIRNRKDLLLFHRWFKGGRLVYKKEFDLGPGRNKLISSKKVTVKDAGEWQVVLIDNRGKVFSEVNFLINP